MSSSLSPSTVTTGPSVPQATAPGEVVGLNLQNTASTELAAQSVTFAETFAAGAVNPTDHLTATIDGQVYAVQMDAKTFNPDGSVAMAVMTVEAPTLPANSTTGVMLSVGGTPTAGTPSQPASLLNALSNYSLSATLDITANAGGATGTQTVNIAQAVTAALQAGTAKMWLNGSLAQEAIVSIPVSGALRIEADVTAYANGQVSATLQFNNDIAMQVNGGTVTYSAMITQNGAVVQRQPRLTQYQYQDWSTTVGTVPSASGLNVQHDIPYLEATGAVPNYDTQYGVPTSSLNSANDNEASQIAEHGWNAPLGNDGITQYMPGVGGRGDIGPTTLANANWLITQNATAADYALGQAQEAGSVPWHFYDPSSGGAFLSTATPGEVNVWSDGRGNPGLSQVVSSDTGWTTDQAHMPDLSYVAYMQTGNVQYLEQLNAQASFAEVNQWNPTRQLTAPNGISYTDIIVDNGEQVRGAAWSLRALQEAAYANPVGTADSAYFTQATDDNYAYLVSMIPTLTQEEGQAHGYLVGAYGAAGQMSPWQQDYFASTVIEGAEMGNQNALTYLQWASNFLVGRFFADTQGFNPVDAITYNLTYYNPADTSGQGPGPNAIYTTWAAIEQETQATGQSNVGTNFVHSVGDYGALALQTLAGIITVSVANPTVMGNYQYQATQAFGWLLASGAPFITPGSTTATTPQFLIDPRLANGQLLSFANVTISTDTAPTLLRPVDSGQNALLYAGSGADTLIGGTGINLLFGGSGADTIIGGPNGNNIFAGSGDETILAGGGTTFIQASSTALLASGTGTDLFVLDATAHGAVTISGFNSTLDQIDLVGSNGSPIGASALASIVASAHSVSGGVALTVSSQETLTIETIGGAGLGPTWFDETSQSGLFGAATPSVPGSSLSGGGTPTVSNSSTTSGSSTMSGGAGSATGSGSTSTVGGSSTTIAGGASVSGDATISAAGGQTSIVAGSGNAVITVGTTGFDSIQGGAGAVSVNGGTATFLFRGGAGSAVLNQQNTATNDQIVAGSGNMTINAGSGTDFVNVSYTGSANSLVINGFSFARDPINFVGFPTKNYLQSATFDASGGLYTLTDGQTVQINYTAPATTGTGNPKSPNNQPQIVSLKQSGQTYIGGGAPVVLADQAGANTIAGGSGGITVTDTAGHDSLKTAANSTNILNLAGADTVLSSGQDLVTMTGGGVVKAGAGQLSFVGGGQASTIFGGTGAATVHSGAGGIDVQAGGSNSVLIIETSGADTVAAGTGNMTLQGSSGMLNFTGGPGHTVINQGTGNALIAAANGNITVNAGSGFDYFSFSAATPGGSMTINNFSTRDNFQYTGVSVGSATYAKGSDHLLLTDGTSITMNFATNTG